MRSAILFLIGFIVVSCEKDVVVSSYFHNYSSDKTIWEKMDVETESYEKIADYQFAYEKDTIDYTLTQKELGERSCHDIGLKDKSKKYRFLKRFACTINGYSDAEAMYFVSKNEIYMIWGAENVVLFDYSKNKSIINQILKNKDWLKADYIPPPPPPRTGDWGRLDTTKVYYDSLINILREKTYKREDYNLDSLISEFEEKY